VTPRSTRKSIGTFPSLAGSDEESGNPWASHFCACSIWQVTLEAFKDREQCESEGYRLVGNRFEHKHLYRLPLYEAKMIHHFDHRFGTYEGQTESQSKTR